MEAVGDGVVVVAYMGLRIVQVILVTFFV